MYIIEAISKVDGELIIRLTAETMKEAVEIMGEIEDVIDAQIIIAQIIEHSTYEGTE